MALIAWVTYNAVGIAKHGFFGYLKHVCVPPGAPGALYVLLVPIEFFTQIMIRPITLSVRLWANFMAGHFLLAVFFLGTIAMLQGGFTRDLRAVLVRDRRRARGLRDLRIRTSGVHLRHPDRLLHRRRDGRGALTSDQGGVVDVGSTRAGRGDQ